MGGNQFDPRNQEPFTGISAKSFFKVVDSWDSEGKIKVSTYMSGLTLLKIFGMYTIKQADCN